MNLLIILLLLGSSDHGAQAARLEQLGSHNLNLRKPGSQMSLAQVSSESYESTRGKRLAQAMSLVDDTTKEASGQQTMMAQINDFFDSMNLGLAQESKTARTDFSNLDSAKVDSSHYKPLTVGLLSAFSVIACCFFSQVLAAGAKKSKLKLNKYYQRKKYEKDVLIQYISKQQQEAEIRTQRDQNIVLGGFNSPNRNGGTSGSQYEERATDGEGNSDYRQSIPNRASHKDDRAKRREQRRTRNSQKGSQNSPISQRSDNNVQNQPQRLAGANIMVNKQSQERDTGDSYQKYVRASKGSSQGASLRRSRDRAQKQNPDVIRETSWDSEKESKKSPVSENQDQKRSNGTEHSKRSNGSAYDKYNLAEDEEPTTSLLKKQ